MQNILLNLIENTIKHHDKDNGHIIVDAKDSGQELEFSVKDDGPCYG